LYLRRGYSSMGILSIISIFFTLSIVFTRKGRNAYKYLTGQSLMMCVICDIQLCFSVCPHVVMQRLCGYSLGYLKNVGISTKIQFIGLIFCCIQMYSSAYICIIYRHQSILPFRSSLKLHSRFEWLLTFLAFDLGHSTLCITFAILFKSAEEFDSSPSFLIIRRGVIAPMEWNLFSAWVVGHTAGALVVTVGLVSFTFWHMIYTLKETR
ncbi:hypothetical protein PFISCL1PPCAC_15026, partial [Pristionchus fissidentatus]